MNSKKYNFLIFSFLLLSSCSNQKILSDNFKFENNPENIGLICNTGNITVNPDETLDVPSISYECHYTPIKEGEFVIEKNFYDLSFNSNSPIYKICDLNFEYFETENYNFSITLKYNPNTTKNIYIETNIGNININNSSNLSLIKSFVHKGDITITNCSTNEIDLGIYTLGNITIDGSFKKLTASINQGNLTFKNSIPAENISCEINEGGINSQISEPQTGFALFYDIGEGNIISDSYSNEIDTSKTSDYIEIKKVSPDLPYYEFVINTGILSFNKIN